jgi:phosphoenolpyruvate phosphomutase
MTNKLRELVNPGRLASLMSAHNPLSARLAELAGFDGIWASGFELSAAYGVPDASLLSFTQHLDMTRAIHRQTHRLGRGDFELQQVAEMKTIEQTYLR